MPVSRLSLFALVLLSFIWGYGWVFMKLGLLDAGPFTFAGMRTLLGGICLLAALPVSGRSLRLERGWEVLLLGLVTTTASVGCAQMALVNGAANRTSILMYTMPFMTLLLAWPTLGEKVRGAQWLAIVCAAAGLLAVVQPWSAHGQLSSQVLILCAALFWSLSAIMTKRMLARAPMDLLSMTAWQLTFGALVLLAIAWGIGEPGPTWTSRYVLALTATGLVSTGFGWFLWTWLLNRLPAGMASMMTLMAPVVAVTSTSLQLGEPLAGSDVLGMALIVLGLVVLSWKAIYKHRAALLTTTPD